jgi:hypothetical protein
MSCPPFRSFRTSRNRTGADGRAPEHRCRDEVREGSVMSIVLTGAAADAASPATTRSQRAGDDLDRDRDGDPCRIGHTSAGDLLNDRTH